MPVFMLWLAGFIYCAHLIIPHDHQYPGAFSDQDEKCPISNERPYHHSGFPLHCHAFNDLISEKFRPVHILPVIQHNFIPLTDSSAGLSFELQISYFDIVSFQDFIPDSFYTGLLLLRAPPSLA
jgi:hypothetical protein